MGDESVGRVNIINIYYEIFKELIEETEKYCTA